MIYLYIQDLKEDIRHFLNSMLIKAIKKVNANRKVRIMIEAM